MMRGRLLGSSGKGPAEWETLFGLGEVLVVSVVGWCTKLSSDVETDHPAGSVAQSTAGFFWMVNCLGVKTQLLQGVIGGQ